jgi:hypothetical protein
MIWVQRLCLILICVPVTAFAVLGERNVASIRRMSAKAAVNPSATVQFQTSQDDAVTIKEFVDGSGVIYAVSWQGPRHPDLSVLLGRYFPEYKIAAATTQDRVPRRRMTASSDNLKISQYGRPGMLFGVIYLKDRLPANVSPEDLQ